MGWAVRGLPLLIVAATLPYLYAIHGQYLFDDYHVIYTNSSLWKVQSFWDVLTFVLKPSKPVTNFFLALGHFFTPAVWGQRVLSLFFHASVVALFWSYLKRRQSPHALLAALFFAILPIHSETIVVGLFRMDILGSFFTLIALHAAESIAQKKERVWWWVLFTAVGLAQLSKEVFAVISPLTLLIFYGNRLGRTFVARLVVTQIFWGSILAFLLTKDAKSEYPYGDVLGLLGWKTHFLLSARALTEGVYKVLFGYGLTTHRLSDRLAYPHIQSLGVAALVFVGAGLILWALLRWKRAPKEWLLAAAGGITVYLLIPNINIGSEHYWYFPALGISVLMALSFSLLPKSKTILATLYGISLLVALEHRVFQMKTRLGFHLAEIRQHPECAAAWINAAIAVMEKNDPKLLPSAKTFIATAKSLAPNYPNLKVTEFLYHMREGNKKATEQSLAELKQLFSKEPGKFERYMSFFNLTFHADS